MIDRTGRFHFFNGGEWFWESRGTKAYNKYVLVSIENEVEKAVVGVIGKLIAQAI